MNLFLANFYNTFDWQLQLNYFIQFQAFEEANAVSTVMNLQIEAKVPISPGNLLFIFPEDEIARQLTLVDFRIYKAIQVK
jgi:hypothetical protein